ncbi:lysine transporter LysE [Heyndrickxia sporothermodurans]|uniref:LysE/ArgO family amino acid transporter n=1 Tax=Heyndrickxia sporothermodurans TaxID=46224 RepID=UPI000D37AD29|nr:LysE/ArgO family amino acid transporter [Heyndrickxia sporothermodurans]PTY77105.1 lysine transporter LysE [Heyndrickxia sporothermodurans]
MLEAILHGILLAFGLILPLGVQNVFVFNQGASQPTFLRALPVVITASICDLILITLAVLGVSVIVLTFAWLKMIIFIIGFLFLLYMGWIIWKSEGDTNRDQKLHLTLKQQITYAASVSLLNPHAILDTIGVIGTNSLSYNGNEKWGFTVACILVSCTWFTGLAITGRLLRKIDTTGKFLTIINKISAIIIWGVAIYMGYQLL